MNFLTLLVFWKIHYAEFYILIKTYTVSPFPHGNFSVTSVWHVVETLHCRGTETAIRGNQRVFNNSYEISAPEMMSETISSSTDEVNKHLSLPGSHFQVFRLNVQLLNLRI